MRQSVAQIIADYNKQNVVCNNELLELQPAVMLQFCNITAGCYWNHWLFAISTLDQNQQYDTYTYYADCIVTVGIMHL